MSERFTNAQVYEAIRLTLVDSYPSTTVQVIENIHRAIHEGKDLPHGVIGMFAEEPINDAIERGLLTEPK